MPSKIAKRIAEKWYPHEIADTDKVYRGPLAALIDAELAGVRGAMKSVSDDRNYLLQKTRELARTALAELEVAE